MRKGLVVKVEASGKEKMNSRNIMRDKNVPDFVCE